MCAVRPQSFGYRLDLLGLLGAREEQLDAVETRAHVGVVLVGDSVSVSVRAEVGRVVEPLEALVDGNSKSGTDKRTNPVDPVVVGEAAVHDGGAEGTGGVEGATSVVDREGLADEEGETDGKRCDEGGTVLLNSKHEDGENEHRGHEDLDPESLGDRCTTTEGGGSAKWAGGEAISEGRAGKTTGELSNGKEDTTERGDAADEDECECHCWVEDHQRYGRNTRQWRRGSSRT